VKLLSAEQAAAFWDARHQRETDLRSGGDVSFDEATNRMFYIRRLGLLLEIIGDQSHPAAPLFVLDAGCGKGWFARELARFGHAVDGIDLSPSALAHCRREGGGPQYFRSSLVDWRSPWLYDVVLAIDVLFHVMDDAEWERSVRNLASLVRLTGRLVLADWGRDHDHVFGNYQVVRSRLRYQHLLAECGLRADGWLPYRFRGSPLGFHVYTRIG